MKEIRYRVVQTTLPAEQPLMVVEEDGLTFHVLRADVISVGEHVTWTYLTRQEVEADGEAQAETQGGANEAQAADGSA